MTKEQTIKAIIVDDEIDACRNLAVLIKQYLDKKIILVGIAQNTNEAERLIRQEQPEVVFLDIEMPEENAFQFLSRVQGLLQFEVIFATAYDEYALRALKLNAVDYILKPISIDELIGSFNRLEERLAYNREYKANNKRNYQQLSDQIRSKTISNSLTLRNKSDVIFVQFEQIIYLKAVGNYTEIYFQQNDKTKIHLAVNNLAFFEEILPENQFFRAHKSFLVNTHQIVSAHKDEGTFITLKDKSTLPLSRRRYPALIEFLSLKKRP